jgi:RNA polymerase sigma factor (sigma-70 family)
MDPSEAPAVVGTVATRFDALWAAYAGNVLAYARRHVDWTAAQEVVSDTFLIAWRRLENVPEEPLPWLLVVARNTIRNQQRSNNRRQAMQFELEQLERLAAPAPGADIAVTDRSEVLAGLASLTSQEREAILLIAWDGLKPADAARVAGCSTATFQVRLHRARRRLRDTATQRINDPEADVTVGVTSRVRKATT